MFGDMKLFHIFSTLRKFVNYFRRTCRAIFESLTFLGLMVLHFHAQKHLFINCITTASLPLTFRSRNKLLFGNTIEPKYLTLGWPWGRAVIAGAILLEFHGK